MSSETQLGIQLQGRSLIEANLLLKLHLALSDIQNHGVDGLQFEDHQKLTQEQVGLYATALYQVLSRDLSDEQKLVSFHSDNVNRMPLKTAVQLQLTSEGQFEFK